jgi:hypothetical protein
MFKHHFTLAYVLKASICFFGYVYSLLLGEPSSTLMYVCIASVIAIPVFAHLEAQQ